MKNAVDKSSPDNKPMLAETGAAQMVVADEGSVILRFASATKSEAVETERQGEEWRYKLHGGNLLSMNEANCIYDILIEKTHIGYAFLQPLAHSKISGVTRRPSYCSGYV